MATVGIGKLWETRRHVSSVESRAMTLLLAEKTK